MTLPEPSATPGPCAGIRIVDMSSMIAGPFCSQILADLGAEVIRIEAAGSDPMRAKYPVYKGMSAMFEQMNRGKKSVCIDVKSEEGRQLIHQLVAQADMFLQNSRPGVMERLGLGYDVLKAINDKLIYVSVSGFGEVGPYATRPAYDMMIQGLTGFMPTQGGEGDPAPIRTTLADRVTAMWASHAALAALLHRERTGEGQKVTVDMASAYAACIVVDQMQNHTFQSAELDEVDLYLGSYRSLKTADGAAIGMILQPAQFNRFVTALGCEDMLGDERFAEPMSILQNTDELYDRVASRVAAMTTKQFIELMDEAQIPFSKVNTMEEFVASDEAHHCGVFAEFDDPEWGTIKHINYPAKFGGSPANARHRAPKLGEHNEEIRQLLAKSGARTDAG
ncbi:CaiB/BaiF CoA transferase family protein [Sphingomonas tagetis]|nr:CoA transferase [Sphingomonas tagetis]